MRSRSLLALGALALTAAACAPAAPKAANPPPPSASAQPKAPPVDAAAKLAALLRNVPRPGPVLDALPPAARSALAARVASLTPEQKLDALSDAGPLVESMPLLHLASGGSSPRALYALAATSACANELSGLLGADTAVAGSPDRARIALLAELAQRGALTFLRDRAADIPAPKAASVLYRYIAHAAIAVERRDIALAALEALAALDPQPDTQLELALARARELDPSGARERLDAANRDAKHPANPFKARRVERSIELALTLTDASRKPSLLEHARALLHLGRLSQVRALLAANAPELERDLGLAAAHAAAALGDGFCPGLPPGVGSHALCASAFHESASVQAALGVLERAWQSGGGRDAEAVEYYVGISRLGALMHLSPELDLQVTSTSVTALANDLEAATRAAPELRGVPLFFAAISALKSKTNNDDALFAQALTLAAQGGRFSEPAVLAVAALLARRRDVAPLLDALPVSGPVQPARAALDAWIGVTQAKQPRLDAARGELAEVMLSTSGESFDRARLVLTMAEGDAVLSGSERSYQMLSRVAGQLLSENIPPDLAFRAVLDTAGALSRGGKRERALEISHDAANAQVPAELGTVHDLWRLVKGYERVLGPARSPAELARVGQELAQLATPPIAPSVQLWLELWGRELEARKAEASCPRAAPGCAALQAGKLRRTSKDWIASQLGSQAATLVERGFLPGGSLNLAFDFSPEDGLETRVSFDAAFLAIELPKR